MRNRPFPLLAAVFFLVVTLLFGFRIVFGGQTLAAAGDIVNNYLPCKFLVKEQLAQGEFPHWNPLTFGGRPLQSDIQTGLFYPPNLLFWFLPLEWAFDLGALFHFWIGAVGMALWMRRRVRAEAALLAGALFMFSGYATARLMSGVVVFPAAMAWFPWTLLCWDRFRESHEEGAARRGWDFAAMALTLSLSVLSGAPQITYYSCAALGLYALLTSWKSGAAGRRDEESYEAAALGDEGEETALPSLPLRLGHVAALGGAFALAAGICAAQILPTAAFIGESWDRAAGASWEYVTNNSLTPRMLLTQISPFFFGNPLDEATYWGQLGYHEVTAYLGAAPLLLVGIFLVGRWGPLRRGWLEDFEGGRRRDAARFEVFLLALLIAALLFAFGKHSPAFWLAYHIVPGFDRFREPGRFLFFYMFAMAALAGWVLDRMTRLTDQTDRTDRTDPTDRTDWTDRTDRTGRTERTPTPVLLMVLFGGAGLLVILWGSVPALMGLMEMPQLAPRFGGRAGAFAQQIAQLEKLASSGVLRFAAEWIAGGALLAAAVLGAMRGKTGGKRLLSTAAVWLFVCLAVAEIVGYGRHFLVTCPRKQLRATQYPATARVQHLREALRDGGRFLWFDSLIDYKVDQYQPELLMNRPILHSIAQLRGYDPVNSRRFGLVMNQMTRLPLGENPGGFQFVPDTPPEMIDWRLIALWDCRAVMSYTPLQSPAIEETAKWEFGGGTRAELRAFRVRAPAGPAHLAKLFTVPPEVSLEQQTALLGNPELDLIALAIVREDEYARDEDAFTTAPVVAAATATAPSPANSSVRLSERGYGWWKFEVQSPEEAVLVLSQNYYPGWKAWLDGRAAPVFPANVAQCGVAVPPGKHRVEWRYRPRAFYQGLVISLVSLALLGLIAWRLKE